MFVNNLGMLWCVFSFPVALCVDKELDSDEDDADVDGQEYLQHLVKKVRLLNVGYQAT